MELCCAYYSDCSMSSLCMLTCVAEKPYYNNYKQGSLVKNLVCDHYHSLGRTCVHGHVCVAVMHVPTPSSGT